MAINAQALLAHDFGEMRQHVEPRDAILYALGVGLGQDPLSDADLAFLDETRLRTLPTFGVTLTTPGMWIRAPEFGVDFGKLVHAAQMAWFPTPLSATADVVGTAKVVALSDRGEGRGAELVLEREIQDAQTGAVYCRLHQTLLLRGDGGFGGAPAARPASLIPDRAHDADFSWETSPRAALIYRLSGDWNPLHIDPATAQRAGFDRPILHGLASYGIAGVAVSRALGKDPATMTQLGCRFSGIVTPGDTLSFHIWRDGNRAVFQAFVGDRKVLDEGLLTWTEQ